MSLRFDVVARPGTRLVGSPAAAPLPGFALIGLALLIAGAAGCNGWSDDAVVAPPKPEKPAGPAAPLPEGEDVADDDPSPPWPRFTVRRVPKDAVLPLPPAERVSTYDLAPDGAGLAAVFARDVTSTDTPPVTTTTTSLWWWDFASPAVEMTGEVLAGRAVDALVWSRFGRRAYLLTHDLTPGATSWRVDMVRFAPATHTLEVIRTVYTSPARLQRLIASPVLYDGFERLVMAREYEGSRSQIISVRVDGTGVYEVTQQKATLTDVTEPALRTPSADNKRHTVRVVNAQNGLPVSIDSDGTLVWEEQDGTVLESRYRDNWAFPQPVSTGRNFRVSSTPNGGLRIRWRKDRAGIELVETAHQQLSWPAAGGVWFAQRPAMTPDGRALVGEVRDETSSKLVVTPVDVPYGAVRGLPALRAPPSRVQRLATQGIDVQMTDARTLQAIARALPRDACTDATTAAPLVTIDPLLEIVGAGYAAAVVLDEQNLAVPRLTGFLLELVRRAEEASLTRLAGAAREALAVLRMESKGPEEPLPKSTTLASRETPELAAAARARTLLERLELNEEEVAALQADARVVAALVSLRGALDGLTPGSREQGLVVTDVKRPAWLDDTCIPTAFREGPRRLLPWRYPLDVELLESTVERRGVAVTCTVAGRGLASGIDLLGGLGVKGVAGLAAPAVQRVYEASQARVGQPMKPAGLLEELLVLVQTTASREAVPEGVAADRWRRRQWSSALALWVGMHHLRIPPAQPPPVTVALPPPGLDAGPPPKVEEPEPAEPEPAPVDPRCESARFFELMTLERPAPVVDPIPEVFAATAAVLARIAEHARATAPRQLLALTLDEAAVLARELARIAEAQAAGSVLTTHDEAVLARAVDDLERLLVRVIQTRPGFPGGTPILDARRAVDVLRTGHGVLHAATGAPHMMTLLVPSRGVLVPAMGPVASYLESVETEPFDDDAWRAKNGGRWPPAWLPVDGRLELASP